MKNVLYAILTFSVLLACMAPATAQNTDTKRITITKEIQQEDGSVIRETIVKEGEAAEDFDLDDYLEDNNDEQVINLNIDIDSNEGITIEKRSSKSSCNQNYFKDKLENRQGFLGVSPTHRKNGQPGAHVEIVRNSAAERAGMQDGDVITKLNDKSIDSFGDIQEFMQDTKYEDAVKITFSREDVEYTANATLGARGGCNSSQSFNFNNMNFNFDDSDFQQSFDNSFNFDEKSKEACLGVYSHRSGARAGSRVSDFTDNSAAASAGMQEGDIITAVNGVAVEDHDELWDEIAKYKANETITVAYNRGGVETSVDVQLNPCEGKTQPNPIINAPRRQKRVIREVIVIKKIADAPADERTETAALPISTNRNLNLNTYRAYPNPTDGIVNIEFEAEATPTTVSLFDLNGRQLFSEELNSFDGSYARQFDLSAYMTSAVVLAVQQGEQVFTERVLVRRD